MSIEDVRKFNLVKRICLVRKLLSNSIINCLIKHLATHESRIHCFIALVAITVE